jgi:hypothetical protein
VKLVQLVVGLALAGVLGPIVLDGFSVYNARQALAGTAETERAFLGTEPGRSSRNALDRLPHVSQTLGLGMSLPGAVYAVVSQATHHNLKVSSTTVGATGERRRGERPVRGLKEYPVRLVLTGTTAYMLLFLQHWPDFHLPIRIDSARMGELTTKDLTQSQLQLSLTVLTQTEKVE